MEDTKEFKTYQWYDDDEIILTARCSDQWFPFRRIHAATFSFPLLHCKLSLQVLLALQILQSPACAAQLVTMKDDGHVVAL